MKTAFAIAPPPPVRRHHRMQAEPVVFAVLLTLLTLGINIAAPKFDAPDTTTKTQPAQFASVR